MIFEKSHLGHTAVIYMMMMMMMVFVMTKLKDPLLESWSSLFNRQSQSPYHYASATGFLKPKKVLRKSFPKIWDMLWIPLGLYNISEHFKFISNKGFHELVQVVKWWSKSHKQDVTGFNPTDPITDPEGCVLRISSQIGSMQFPLVNSFEWSGTAIEG